MKFYRGDVIYVKAPDSNGGFKKRPVVVLKDTKKNDTVITVYCTKQNDGNDKKNILVLLDSIEGKEMGLTYDTYIRPNNILNLPMLTVDRLIGKCSLMKEIQKIIDDSMAS